MNTRKRTVQNNQVLVPHKKHRKATTTTTTSKSSDDWRASEVVAQLEKALRDHGNPADAASMKKYMREQFEFFGVKSPRRRELCREIFVHVREKDLENSKLRGLVSMLWDKPQRELQHGAMDFLESNKRKICCMEEEFDENMAFFKSLLVTKSWWDTVDMLASKLVGYLVRTHPERGRAVMEEWVEGENMWLRRTAILHQLGSKVDTDSDLLFQFCLARCHEEEFFIRKAIGWALREFARFHPTQVRRFLQKNKNSLSKLSYNEASKHLNMAKK